MSMSLRMVVMSQLAAAAMFIATPTACGQNTESARLVCMEIGLTPDLLAAAGASSERVQAGLAELEEAQTLLQTRRQLQLGLTENAEELKTLQSQLRLTESASVSAVQSEIDSLLNESTGLQTQLRSLETHIAVMFLPSTMSSDAVGRLVFPASDLRGLPPVYRLAELTPDEASQLRAVLAGIRRAAARDESIEETMSQALNAFNAIPAVSLGLAQQAANEAGVRAVLMP